MEIAGEDGSKLVLREPVTIFGRGSGFASKDRTVSRRHILIEAKTSENSNGAPIEPTVSFEVIGRNPIWVRSSKNGEIRTFRRSEKGEMALGESFCVGSQEPIWFELNKIAEFEERKQFFSRSSDSVDIDVSGIDPVKEFGFLAMGHEFECYGNRVIRDPKKWDWFLDEPRKDSDDDEDYGRKKKRGVKGKRKKGANSDDEDWTDENEDAVEMITKTKKFRRPKYSTRSKDRHKTPNDQKKAARSNKDYDEEVEEDEDDETLGGFIVDDEEDNVEQMDEDEDEDEEEEEFSDDDEED
ncbi:protein PIF [Benincasa hispida]|uniref:protein PIF n=1 Tax=Benincasa hispida TaxID=102211 RepID=UPI0018FF3EB5|nr:protein PIF [Benincasa hispida]